MFLFNSNPRAADGRRIRVMVVDNDPLMRIAIRLQVEKMKGVQVVAAASASDQAMMLIDSLHPDLVVGDMSNSEIDGTEFIAYLSRFFPGTRVILLDGEPLTELNSDVVVHGRVAKDQLCKALQAEIYRVFAISLPA